VADGPGAALPVSGTIFVKISRPASTATGTAITVAHRAALRIVRSGAGGWDSGRVRTSTMVRDLPRST
jgi:hypothetical protein